MAAGQGTGTVFHRLAEGTTGQVLDVLGPTVEFLTYPEDDALCTLRGVVRRGVAVPLHSHADREDFLILAGTQQVLVPGAHGLEWAEARAGDYVRIPSGAPHAHRNVGSVDAVDLIITTAQMGRFFQEVGRPVTGSPRPPTPEDLARFAAVAAKYGYRLGTPEENAAVGIPLPKF
jgi:quercetin dioxygenase-like cupin family protein